MQPAPAKQHSRKKFLPFSHLGYFQQSRKLLSKSDLPQIKTQNSTLQIAKNTRILRAKKYLAREASFG
jgi:hypothetical protein